MVESRAGVEKAGTIGAIVAAAACPICFPKLALIGALVGLGALAPYEVYIAYGVQALFGVALAGHVVAYRRHRRLYVPVMAAAAMVMMLAGFWLFGSTPLMLASVAVLAAASLLQVVEARRCAACAAQPSA